MHSAGDRWAEIQPTSAQSRSNAWEPTGPTLRTTTRWCELALDTSRTDLNWTTAEVSALAWRLCAAPNLAMPSGCSLATGSQPRVPSRCCRDCHPASPVCRPTSRRHGGHSASWHQFRDHHRHRSRRSLRYRHPEPSPPVHRYLLRQRSVISDDRSSSSCAWRNNSIWKASKY